MLGLILQNRQRILDTMNLAGFRLMVWMLKQ